MDSILIPSVCIALLVALLAGVVHPILTKRHVWLRATGYKLLILQLTERKEQLYASIKELEFDHSLGKISEEDYAALRGDLEAEAVAVLQKLDTVAVTTESEEDLDARIEADITAQRAVASAPSKGAAPAAAPGHVFCHGCGQARTPEYQFCPHCGQSFTASAS
jgi:hypothetical protein|tara:strand:- start:8 stop:499 length:492 start_codon:yes stop_codon:yes gene_type:complete